jgi:hypothetical protein
MDMGRAGLWPRAQGASYKRRDFEAGEGVRDSGGPTDPTRSESPGMAQTSGRERVPLAVGELSETQKLQQGHVGFRFGDARVLTVAGVVAPKAE